MLPNAHTEPHAAAIIAELLYRFDLADREETIIEEALDYLAAARREHPKLRLFGPDDRDRSTT